MNKLMCINFKPNIKYLEGNYSVVFEKKYKIVIKILASPAY